MDQRYRTWSITLAALALVGCDSGTAPRTEFHPRIDRTTCDLDTDLFLSITNWDAIPSIDDPDFVSAGSPFTAYLAPDDRVVGFLVQDQAYAVPHNILWHHEIVNLDSALGPIAITYCPLTGSSIAYNRANADGAPFGVTGFLYKNNLVMFDRQAPNSIWVQMEGEASCGPKRDTGLTQWPVFEMRWENWRELHPQTLVMSQSQGDIGRDYSVDSYPYTDYEMYSNDEFLFPHGMPELDRRRPVKERVLGVPASGTQPAIAFPFDALTAMDGSRQVVSFNYGNQDALVLWDDDARGGMAFYPLTFSGDDVELEPSEDGFVDQVSGTLFLVDGQAVSGPLAGTRLRTIDNAYVAFWGAWAVFHEGTELWNGGGS